LKSYKTWENTVHLLANKPNRAAMLLMALDSAILEGGGSLLNTFSQNLAISIAFSN
jgi:hypothetical protein